MNSKVLPPFSFEMFKTFSALKKPTHSPPPQFNNSMEIKLFKKLYLKHTSSLSFTDGSHFHIKNRITD